MATTRIWQAHISDKIRETDYKHATSKGCAGSVTGHIFSKCGANVDRSGTNAIVLEIETAIERATDSRQIAMFVGIEN